MVFIFFDMFSLPEPIPNPNQNLADINEIRGQLQIEY